MSISVSEVIAIVLTIKNTVDNFYANNAICKELSRLVVRLQFFLESNELFIRSVNNVSVHNSILHIKDVLDNVIDEIRKYDSKGIFKHLLKSQKYSDRFKQLCLDINNSQQSLQTILITFVSQKVSDMSEDITFVCETVCDISDQVIISNCDAVIEQFSSEFVMLFTERFDKLEGLLELSKDDQQSILSKVLQKQETELNQILSAIEELKKSSTLVKRNYGADMIRSAYKAATEPALGPSDLNIDWSNSLGQGSFGEVFFGQYNNENVAVKVLKVSDRNQFLDECSVLRRVNGSPFIIRYIGWICLRPPMVLGECHCLITNFCPISLKHKIDNKENYRNENILHTFMKYLRQIAIGLGALAKHGVMNRDLKPENVLITDSDDVAIADFGMAVTKSSFLALSTNSALRHKAVGTSGYRAPELQYGKCEYASDVYSFGVLSCYLILGKYPWFDQRGNPLPDDAITYAISHGQLPRAFEQLTIENFPIINPKVFQMIRSCLALEPTKRPSYNEIEHILHDYAILELTEDNRLPQPPSSNSILELTEDNRLPLPPPSNPILELKEGNRLPPAKPPKMNEKLKKIEDERLKKIENENHQLKLELEKLKLEKELKNEDSGKSLKNEEIAKKTDLGSSNSLKNEDLESSELNTEWMNSFGYIVRNLAGHNATVTSLAMNDTIIVSGSSDFTIKVWTLASNTLALTIECHAAVRCVGLSADSSIIAACFDGSSVIKLYRSESGECLHELGNSGPGHTADVRCLSMSKTHNSIIVSGSKDKTIRVWASSSHIKYGTVLLQTLKGHDSYVESIEINNSMDLIVSGSVDNTIICWRRSEDRYVNLRTLRGHTGDIHSVSITDDSKFIASASGDKTIKIWNSKTGELVSTLKGHDHWVYSVKFLMSKSKRILVSGGRDDRMILWNLDGGTNRIISAHNNSIFALSISHQFVASGSSDKLIKVFDCNR